MICIKCETDKYHLFTILLMVKLLSSYVKRKHEKNQLQPRKIESQSAAEAFPVYAFAFNAKRGIIFIWIVSM